MICCWVRQGQLHRCMVYPWNSLQQYRPDSTCMMFQKERKKDVCKCYLHVAPLCWSVPWDVFELWTTLWVWNIWGHRMSSENNCSIYDISTKSPRLKALAIKIFSGGRGRKKHTLTVQILLQNIITNIKWTIHMLRWAKLVLLKNKSNE